jgi:hypothetical protein
MLQPLPRRHIFYLSIYVSVYLFICTHSKNTTHDVVKVDLNSGGGPAPAINHDTAAVPPLPGRQVCLEPGLLAGGVGLAPVIQVHLGGGGEEMQGTMNRTEYAILLLLMPSCCQHLLRMHCCSHSKPRLPLFCPPPPPPEG